MKEIYSSIWKLALPYQDKRGDEGHAETVLNYAIELVKSEGADEEIVIPAAILHDIGWSKLPKEERLGIFGKIKKEDKQYLQKKHEITGVDLAKNILEQVNYDTPSTEEILEIISGHDTRAGFISKNEGVVRDADKLWRFSKKGFWVDVIRGSYTPNAHYKKLKDNVKEKDFFYSETAKNIAKFELEKRKNEF